MGLTGRSRGKDDRLQMSDNRYFCFVNCFSLMVFNQLYIHNYQELQVYQRALAIAKDIVVYFKDKRPYSLTQQIVRSAISVPSNISEGAERASQKEFLRFLSISLGSAAELGTQLEIDSSILDKEEEAQFIANKINELSEIRAMTRGLMNTVSKSLS